MTHQAKVAVRRLSREVVEAPNTEHFLSAPWRDWLLTCAELTVARPQLADGEPLWEEPEHKDGGASILHMGMTLYGRRDLRCQRGEGATDCRAGGVACFIRFVLRWEGTPGRTGRGGLLPARRGGPHRGEPPGHGLHGAADRPGAPGAGFPGLLQKGGLPWFPRGGEASRGVSLCACVRVGFVFASRGCFGRGGADMHRCTTGRRSLPATP